MSDKQFERFYWPGLKKVLLSEIELGFVPVARFQGGFTSRLEYLLELPKGKAVAYFDQTDMFRAKEVLGRHLCIMGNVPTSLLQLGSSREVEEYCRKLIQICGKDGGFILVNGGGMDQAKPANIKAMVDSVKKYSAF
jgi:uroporphyrinogen-III decarboxylase